MGRDSKSDEFRFEPVPILRTLVAHDVRFVLIGGLAGHVHGSTSFTRDTDICYERTPENMERLAAALRELRVTLRGADAGLPFKIDALTIRNGLNFTFDTDYGWFDCLGEASGYAYDVLVANAEPADVGDGVVVQVTSLDDLIRMKRAAGRHKDLVEVENLSKLRDVREAVGLYGLGVAPDATWPPRPRRTASAPARPRRRGRSRPPARP